MRVLVACERSNTVRDSLLALGHDAWSCDLQIAEHPNPNYKRHLRCDVRPLLLEPWDLVIAHPPCTYLCNSGVRWLTERHCRWEKFNSAVEFFHDCLAANAPRVCVENPIQHGHAKEYIPPATQLIQPWQFGHGETKATYLWLKGLPELVPTKIVEGREANIHHMGGKDRSNQRSVTYKGIAAAMAAQWGGQVG